jgi:hypothetical protein
MFLINRRQAQTDTDILSERPLRRSSGLTTLRLPVLRISLYNRPLRAFSVLGQTHQKERRVKEAIASREKELSMAD